jgi:flagellar biogenesis protein FliO
MVIALVVVVGLIVGSSYLLRRAARPRGEAAEAGLLNVVARAPLGPRREVVLLRAAGHHIVVAQTPSSVQSLAHFAIDETDDRTGDHPDDFAGCLIQQGDTGGGDVSESKREPLPVSVRSA